jgi:rhomboid protease GluP
MADSGAPTPEELLRLCAAAAPKPWYPKAYARTSGTSRESLDAPLADLRVYEVVKLTDWEPELGQGYVLTAFGEEVLQKPNLLAQLRRGLTPRNDEKKTDQEADGEPRSAGMTPFERGEIARKALTHPGKAKATPILILLNVLVFMATLALALWKGAPLGEFLLQGDPKILQQMGALTAMDLVRDEWWRLITCCFLHFGLIHLAVNMYALYVLGKVIEPMWGIGRFLVLYFLSGIGGAACAMLYDPGTPAGPVLAGASGAIWGLMCSIAAWIGLNRRHLPPQLIRQALGNWWFAILLNIAISFHPLISAPAHFGGGAVGVLVASLLYLERFSAGPQRSLATALLALTPVFFIAALNSARESDPRWQRLVRANEEREREAALTAFRDGPAVRVKEIRALRDQVETAAAPIVYTPAAKRDPKAVEDLRRDLAALQEKCGEALHQLGENASPVGAVEKLRQAGREYTDAVQKLAAALDGALDPSKPEPEGTEAHLRQLRKSVDAAWQKWAGLVVER